MWTLYKEVQRYWDRGLRAPDDVTVVLTDDNWGNIRKHPDPAEPARPGGYGLYYHFDYVGRAATTSGSTRRVCPTSGTSSTRRTRTATTGCG